MDKAKSPSLINLAVTALIFIAALTYGFIALSTEDPLWIIGDFEEYPESIFLNCYGQTSTLLPEDERFDELVAKVNAALSTRKNYDSLTMSELTYEEYRTGTTGMILELVYSNPIRIHSFYRFFANLDSIVIPLDGRHAITSPIFGRANGQSTAGSLHYLTLPEVRSYIETQGLCTKP